MAQGQEEVGEFPVISNELEDDEGAVDEGLGAPGVPFQKDWRIRRVPGDGDPVGLVHVQLTRSHKALNDEERIVLHVVFEFDGGDVLVAAGALPFRSPPDWFDSGRLAILGGTGPYKGLTKNLFVDVTNPKRWSIGGP